MTDSENIAYLLRQFNLEVLPRLRALEDEVVKINRESWFRRLLRSWLDKTAG